MRLGFRSRFRWAAGLVLLGACACGGSTEPDSGAPTPCFDLIVEHGPSVCAYDSTYVLDATCSTDDATRQHFLEVRWDLDADGDWDTPFSLFQTHEETVPAAGSWTVRCEVMDDDGLTSALTRTFSVGPRLVSPDIIAESILFSKESEGYVTTAAAGDTLMVEFVHQCVGTFSLLHMSMSLDGAGWFDGGAGCSGTGVGCHLTGLTWMPSTPGSYTFQASLDPGNEFPEHDEGNNVASGTITIGPPS